MVKLATICYVDNGKEFLMLHRNKKPNDVHAGKWIGVGGKLEKNETPEQCLFREVKEETGLILINYVHRGIVIFNFNDDEPLYMYLYTSKNFSGKVQECSLLFFYTLSCHNTFLKIVFNFFHFSY